MRYDADEFSCHLRSDPDREPGDRLGYQNPTPPGVHITNPQRDSLAPPQTGIGKESHQCAERCRDTGYRAVANRGGGGFLSQPGDLLVGQNNIFAFRFTGR